jgi:hypothetical protein
VKITFLLKEKSRQIIPLSLFIDISYIYIYMYIGIEPLRPFEEMFVGETFGSVDKQTSPLKWIHKYFVTLLKHLSYMSQCQTL